MRVPATSCLPPRPRPRRSPSTTPPACASASRCCPTSSASPAARWGRRWVEPNLAGFLRMRMCLLVGLLRAPHLAASGGATHAAHAGAPLPALPAPVPPTPWPLPASSHPPPLLPQGALYASRSNSESQSTVVYRPYESWAPNSDWSLTLPSEPRINCALRFWAGAGAAQPSAGAPACCPSPRLGTCVPCAASLSVAAKPRRCPPALLQ